VTVSVGYACLPSGDTPSCAFDRADEALYFAKQNGRNRIQSYEILLARGAARRNRN